MRRSSVIRDTIKLTLLQFVLESITMLLNVWITRQVGASIVGIVALTGSFFALANTIAGGNAFLCVSRLVSEEIGKPVGDPNRVLRDAIWVCVGLSAVVTVLVVAFADGCSQHFFHQEGLTAPIRMMACMLLPGSICACWKGYFNALRQVNLPAICDVLEFGVRVLTLAVLLWSAKQYTAVSVCKMIAWSSLTATAFAFLFLWLAYHTQKQQATGPVSISMKQYWKLAVPIMTGSWLTAALSSANDALIPYTLKQFGDSTDTAFSQFGIFEAIVIPVLFFPSTILCAMSGILVSEVARAAAGNDRQRITRLTQKVIQTTLLFSFFIVGILMRFGSQIGVWMDGGQIAGRFITLLAPVVPFIYLEIVLESIIKGMGYQRFSSCNYLAEYVIRISVVLICIPIWGFYGIVLSYYMSNVFGNCNRLRVTLKITGWKHGMMRSAGKMLFAVCFAFQVTELLMRCLPIAQNSLPYAAGFLLMAGCLYLFVLRLVLEKLPHLLRYFATIRSAD